MKRRRDPVGVTIKDIARQAGMSVSAVSLVLNNRPCRISEAKKQEIREIAARLQYQPNQMARSLVTKETKMLALILPDIENIFFSSLAKRIEDGCRREGYLLIIANSGDRSAEDRALLHSIAARGVDGIFLIVSNESYRDNTALLAELGGLSIPFVMVDRVYEDFVCDQVLFDNEEGGYLAARHLIGMGHTRIGCIANTAANNGRARLRGYRKAMEEAGLAAPDEWIAQGDYRMESGYRAADPLLHAGLTAVFATNDMMALGFLRRLYEKGKRVPADFSVVGYDDALDPFLLGNGLTTVAQDAQQLGDAACRLLIHRIRSGMGDPQAVRLRPALIVRGSVRACGAE